MYSDVAQWLEYIVDILMFQYGRCTCNIWLVLRVSLQLPALQSSSKSVAPNHRTGDQQQANSAHFQTDFPGRHSQGCTQIRGLERRVQILVSRLRTAGQWHRERGCECRIVGFLESYRKWSDTAPPLIQRNLWGKGLSGRLTFSLVMAPHELENWSTVFSLRWHAFPLFELSWCKYHYMSPVF